MLTRQWKLMVALRTLRHATLDNRRAPRTCEGSSISYVKRGTAFRTLNYLLFSSHRGITFVSYFVGNPFVDLLKALSVVLLLSFLVIAAYVSPLGIL
jgi:hypothetical protein